MLSALNASIPCNQLCDLENDLPSLACQAAIELDNLILGYSTDLEAVRRLISYISGSFTTVSDLSTGVSALDATTAVLIRRALHDSELARAVPNLEELVIQAKDVTSRLQRLVDEPRALKEYARAELGPMRSFCLTLSKHALGFERGRHEMKPEHPFRR